MINDDFNNIRFKGYGKGLFRIRSVKLDAYMVNMCYMWVYNLEYLVLVR